MKASRYEKDVIAWSQEQAQLLRSGRFSELDIEHLAEEIEDVGKSEQRELASRMAVLLAHLLKWQYQPGRRGVSWQLTIKTQRAGIERRLAKTPSLKTSLADPEWWADAWGDAMVAAVNETGLGPFPERCPWSVEQVLSAEWLPE
ncbi:DUF29 domain-containing protein [Burkholderia stagnalis]|uniref:DUF29 domain-containing protein n=1 Tax=Burkholderia stagnalis TaxID=1503054 RepID=UPI000F5DA32D|nr:DUF29 domain-containing protein [Burkholderia stagnalis]RQY08307.1 DUF29 domain-containing protein [Burkholderia stagnalis]TCW78739.1 DUF29 domain-containing protein [Burkholderia sp. SRS-46]